MGKRKWVLAGWILMGWVLTSGMNKVWAVPPDQVEKDLSQKQKDLKEIKKELSRTKEKEKKIEGKESSILDSLQGIETQLSKGERELREMEAQLVQTEERLRQTKTQMTMLNKGMEQTKEELVSRLIALYKMGRTPPETFLLTSQSYVDLLRTDKYLRVIIDFDARLVETYRYQMALKERYQETLVQDQLQWQRNISEVEKKKEEIKKVREAKRALLRSIQHQKVVYKKVIGELEERTKELQTLIGKLERERSLFAYGKSRHEAIKGKLIPPVEGKVISLFKERGQNGIEIKAPTGAEIRAVLPGRILYADWFKGFGNIVVIDHGDHTFTVSAYCSQLLKKAGDTVSQGEAIAQVGSAGSLKGSCLYFEIRHQGKPEDPLNWISHPDRVVSLPKGQE
ncbi:MAG: peptidoglycan DD-metalloendopeptidase family protein [Thermodesulfobacteriota bacterium]|jgi:septal ring factor EnvC (AmiA/AmiB activator)